MYIVINNCYYQIKSQNENENNIESLLAEVIDDQLKADVSVDLLLSGGIDSSIIAYITKNILNKQVKLFHYHLQIKNMTKLTNQK